MSWFLVYRIFSFEGHGIWYRCSEILRGLLHMFFLTHGNLLNLEESADTDLRNLKTEKYCDYH